MKKTMASLMAVMMLASMSTGAFADQFDVAENNVQQNKVVLESENAESRINKSGTIKLKANYWTKIAGANNIFNEDIMVRIDNLSGASEVNVRMMKDGAEYLTVSLGNGEQYSFDCAWDDGSYGIYFETETAATVTYTIKTL